MQKIFISHKYYFIYYYQPNQYNCTASIKYNCTFYFQIKKTIKVNNKNN